jgi:uncharacterized protein YcbX
MGNDEKPETRSMSIVGTVESLWRYPIKSMAGEALAEAFVGYAGIYGDRMYGFLHSLQTIQQLGDEVDTVLDKRRFRANIYAQLTTANGFAEDSFIGRKLQIGSRVVVAVLHRDARCMMITIDPDTAQETPAIMRNVARSHGGNAGIYCAVMTEGMVRLGDSIVLLD